jgi:hypothetical protein
VYTPEQLQILKKMSPYLEGLTPEQARQLGFLDAIREGYEAGEKAGNAILVLIIAFIVVETPASESAMVNAIAAAERILQKIDERCPVAQEGRVAPRR